MRDTLPLPSRQQGGVEEERAKSTVVQARATHKENEATRLSTQETAAEAAASVTAALDRWHAAEMSRRRVVEEVSQSSAQGATGV